eukprot:2316708-Prymnesium_polylepis.1
MIDADVQALVWAHVPEFDFDAEGTEFGNRRWVTRGAQFLPHREVGLAILHWPSHLKALYAAPWPAYPDGAQGNWKLLLDQW